jgi:hypothetical protein
MIATVYAPQEVDGWPVVAEGIPPFILDGQYFQAARGQYEAILMGFEPERIYVGRAGHSDESRLLRMLAPIGRSRDSVEFQIHLTDTQWYRLSPNLLKSLFDLLPR